MNFLDSITDEDADDLREASRRAQSLHLFESPTNWPLGDYLPVTRWVVAPNQDAQGGEEVDVDLDAGVMVRLVDGRSEPVVRVIDGDPYRYKNFDELAAAGWRAD